MKRANLTNRRMLKADLDSFKTTLTGSIARFECKEVKSGEKGVELTQCGVWFDEETEIGNAATRAAFNLEQHWRDILQICTNHGFEVA